MKKTAKVFGLILVGLTGFILYILLFSSSIKYTIDIEIDKPCDTVFALFDDTANMKEYLYGIQSYEHISGDFRQKGSKYKLKVKMGDREIEMLETITKRASHEMAFTYEADGVFNSVDHKFVSVSENKTKHIAESEFQFQGFMKIIAFLMPGQFKKQTGIYLKDFKAFAEKQN